MLLKISGVCSLILCQFVGFNPLINLATCFDSPSPEAYYVLIVFEIQTNIAPGERNLSCKNYLMYVHDVIGCISYFNCVFI